MQWKHLNNLRLSPWNAEWAASHYPTQYSKVKELVGGYDSDSRIVIDNIMVWLQSRIAWEYQAQYRGGCSNPLFCSARPLSINCRLPSGPVLSVFTTLLLGLELVVGNCIEDSDSNESNSNPLEDSLRLLIPLLRIRVSVARKGVIVSGAWDLWFTAAVLWI